ncbi:MULTISPECIES: polyprenyl synthetase family protein [Streptococcus]|uniref:Farnesyl diphosphate synthase n=1 Tax=Streptococcus infantis SPAR10 TaxID=1159208 RepID=J1S893_9STRE|nr:MULTISPECIES: farnesyl diphosphate synthase [Streptococcus]RKV82771.1 MAG: polyprenyl synthetase family protein [Streptococcus sp.]EJG85915.1 geranyltranstransferase [Streptococcus infantis SPAR10]MCP8993425.1 polyprenyl synthetase family protein [Streptococcus sp. CF9-3]MCP8996809.1 polyprenyl synthetase family protein [Streptococcus sp. CF9-1]OFQ05406.1 geranyl transferase [Streptococcus sp. HMSC062D07]
MNKQEKLALVESALEEFYGDQQLAANLREAVLYSIHAGGKRIRPYLLLEVLESLQVPITIAHAQVAAALEMIHTGSLIHDDLPAMDDDDFRRGRLTNHKKFGEALAILAGDALFLDPYALIAQADLPNEIKVDLIASLSLSSGSMGMVAGQVLDMEGEGKHLNLEELQTIHANKTGKLLAFPFQAAGVIAGLDENLQKQLKTVGELIGLAFQVRDDILDVTASFEEIGKTPQKDLQAEKSTYPALLGLDEAKVFCNRTLDQANEKLDVISQLVDFDKEPIVKIVESLRINA